MHRIGMPVNGYEKSNLHERCNLGARYRWGIESEILVEKCCGYQYEHMFSYDWNVMKGFHYLMKIGRTINVLVQYSECLAKMFIEKGVRGFIRFVRNTISGPWLDAELVRKRLADVRDVGLSPGLTGCDGLW